MDVGGCGQLAVVSGRLVSEKIQSVENHFPDLWQLAWRFHDVRSTNGSVSSAWEIRVLPIHTPCAYPLMVFFFPLLARYGLTFV